jgi:hypothetical protein
MSITEDRQSLAFDSNWRVLKWDEAPEFVEGQQSSLQGLGGGIKAADVVGVRSVPSRPRTVLVAEFKDFDHPKVPPGHRPKVAADAVSEELMRDIVRKVIDTLAGATFAHDSQSARCAELDAWRPALGRSTTTMLVLLCIEVPKSQAVVALAWTKKLQQKFRWLGPHARVVVTNGSRPFSGLGITYRVS